MSCAILHFRVKATPFNWLQFLSAVLTVDFAFAVVKSKSLGIGDGVGEHFSYDLVHKVWTILKTFIAQ